MKLLIFIKYLFAIIGMCLLVGSFLIYQNTTTFLAGAIKTEGIVIELVRLRSSGSTMYAPMVRFKTTRGNSIEFTSTSSSNPPLYSKGEKVEVLYEPMRPHSARINGFFSVWGAVSILALIGGFLFIFGVGIILMGARQAKRKEHLLQHGVRINTKIQSVSRNNRVTTNGRSPFIITSQWLNPTTSKLHIFVSDNIWFDPKEHIKADTIMVYIEPQNPEKYYMDISFLPELAKG